MPFGPPCDHPSMEPKYTHPVVVDLRVSAQPPAQSAYTHPHGRFQDPSAGRVHCRPQLFGPLKISEHALSCLHFRVRAAFRPHCSGCPFPSPHLKAPGSATQGHARDRVSRAAPGNPQDTRPIRPILFRKECQGCNEARKPSCPAPHI